MNVEKIPTRALSIEAHDGTSGIALEQAYASEGGHWCGPGRGRKGKRKLVSRLAAGNAPPKKDTLGRGHGSESSSEDKAAPPPVKKAPAAAKGCASEAPPAPRRTTRSDGGLDLGTFMASIEPGASSADAIPTVATISAPDPPTAAHAVPIGAEMVAQLRAIVAMQPSAQAPSLSAPLPLSVPSAPTAPNAKGEMPPVEVCYRTTASFPEGAKKAKGDYNPPQAHMLAASRLFRAYGTETGKALSAMSLVLWMRELESVKFQVTPAVLMAIFNGRLSSRGLTLTHFKESSEMVSLDDGSTNANFSSGFSPSTSLPPATTRCGSYEDILALHGLNALGQEVWYDHMRKLTSRLRNFVSKNKSANPANTSARVRLTLPYANKFIGAALGHMQTDDTEWWS
ncbi:hypothetical protein BBJ28_00003084 [Nothophytophthora sp. Chile5]|nr:hypothetical protein BBJ28_00003084 [Nothophytophthora sp. Chile5]